MACKLCGSKFDCPGANKSLCRLKCMALTDDGSMHHQLDQVECACGWMGMSIFYPWDGTRQLFVTS